MLIKNLTAGAALNQRTIIGNERNIQSQLLRIGTRRNIHSACRNQKNLACRQSALNRLRITLRNGDITIQ